MLSQMPTDAKWRAGARNVAVRRRVATLFLIASLVCAHLPPIGGTRRLAAGALLVSQGCATGLVLGSWFSVPLTLLALPLALRWPVLAVDVDGGLIYVVVFGGCLRLFALSLCPGHEPLISALARRVHGALRPDVARYTRWLTVFWSVFFALALAAPPFLYALGPRGAWRWPMRGGSIGCVLVLMIAETGVRRMIIRDFAHVSIRTTVAAFRDATARSAIPTCRPDADT